tara:strand:- start:15071 stop:16342 length:1272 start_codon:yes stop_codon:yes gene_type:complete
MKFRKALKSDSVKDFSSLFFSNILQKLFGLVREPVVAFFFGSSLFYANYLLLRTIADLFSQFTVGNALKANLLPKFTKTFQKYKNLSFKSIMKFSKSTMVLLFILSQIIQLVIILILDSQYSFELLFISILLSISICFNFLNTIFLTILQARAKFLSYSIATTLNSFLVAVFIYPFTLFFSVFGLVFSRLIGILSLTFFYVIPMNKKNIGYDIPISKNDLNFSTLILGNFANIIIITARMISGSDGGVYITYFTYSVFILNALLTSVVGNISTLLLRKVSIKRNNMFMIYSLLISIIVGFGLVVGLEFYGYELIRIVYMRGEFNLNDVENTTIYIQKLSYAFVLIFISTTFFQPFFSMKLSDTKYIRRKIALIFISTVLLSIIFCLTSNIDVILESLLVIYFGSIASLFLSVYSYFYYIKSNN